MSIFDLFKSDGVKKALLKQVAAKAKEAGIKRMLLYFDEKGEVVAEPLNDDIILIEKKDHEFYKQYFLDNKPKIDLP